jgi:hypothetical protein
VVAVAENDRAKLATVAKALGKDQLAMLSFELDMNILNLAIDQEAQDVVLLLRDLYKEDRLIAYKLVSHKYYKGMQAIHQCMSVGNLAIIEAVVDLGANVDDLMHEQMHPLHCAAQTYHGLVSILYMT